jgi:hypothetical protein
MHGLGEVVFDEVAFDSRRDRYGAATHADILDDTIGLTRRQLRRTAGLGFPGAQHSTPHRPTLYTFTELPSPFPHSVHRILSSSSATRGCSP